GDRVVVVIDGRDEAEATPVGHNWLHLPGDLPEGVYIVLTYRPGQYPITTEASLPIGELTITWDDPRHQTDIGAHLARQSKRPEIIQALRQADPPISAERFVSALQNASQGNFMYLYYVLEDIIQSRPGYAPLRMENLPRGLIGYYEQFWAQLAQVKGVEGWTEWRDLYRPVIALLAAAGEPVTTTWLADMTDRDADEIGERALIR